MPIRTQSLADADPEIAKAISAENRRQEDHIELIASENYTGRAVMEAQGSSLTNKYAEGYPGKRYYAGCEFVDIAEQLAIDRVKELFDAEFANVQPHSGTQANPYGLEPETELIDYSSVERLAREHKPKLIIAGASAYSRVIEWARFREIADAVGAYLMVDMAHYAGLIAADVYPTPVGIAHFVTSTTHKTLRGPRGGFILAGKEHEKLINSAVFPGLQGGPLMHVIAAKAVAFKQALSHEFKVYQARVLENARVLATVLQNRGLRIVSGGTDSHMFLVDLRAKNITGKDAEAALTRANITVNKNAIPNDPQKPFVTSGVRIGSPAVTTRGFSEIECEELAHLIADVLDAPADAKTQKRVAAGVKSLTTKFPVYR